MIVLVDNGHGFDTPGKGSPDGILREWKYAREIAAEVEKRLKEEGITTIRIVTEDKDVSLTQRVNRVNTICKEFGAKNCCLVSIHLNAMPPNDNKWHTARGFCVMVSKNASGRSKKLAQMLYAQAEKNNLQGNRCVPKEKYWVQNLAICRDTNCAAVLTENLFQDNKEDVSYLLSLEGRNTIVDLHVKGIINYIKSVAA